MSNVHLTVLSFIAAVGVACDAGATTVNGRAIAPAQLVSFERALGSPIPPGDYWYDARSGLGGPWGESARIYLPGFDFGPVPTDASGGDTGIYYNGRELNLIEARFIAALFGIPEVQIPQFRGRYVLEATGDVFTEDGVYVGNLAALAAQRGGGSGSGCTAVRIPSTAPSPTGVKQTIDVATGTDC
jgi:hypothetical protein